MIEKIKWKGSDELVSAMCLGTMYFGSRVDPQTSYRIMDAYLDHGGNFLDTANNYAFWIDGCVGDESETLLGRYFSDRKNRDRIFLATKLGARPLEVGGNLENREGASPDAINRAIRDSLRRLGVDHIDLLYIHIDDRKTPLEDSLEALDRLVQQGVVRYIGISNITAWRFAEARGISKVNGLTPFTAVQNFYTYLRDRHEQVFNLNKIGQSITLEFVDMANVYQDFNLLAYGPLLKGAYARGEFQPWDEQEARFGNADGKARLACLKDVASELDVSVNQLVLAYVMNTEPGIIPIFGASTKEQFEDNMGVLKIEWTPELTETLYHAGA